MTAIIPTKPQLLDHRGQPIDMSKLRRVVSQPTVSGVRSVISGHPASGLSPERLATILRAAEQGDATRYLELAEQMEEKDLHYLGVLGQRKRAVSQLEITVEAAGDDAEAQSDADFVRDWIIRESVEVELFHQLDAVGKGFSLLEIEWDMSERQWWPDRLIWVDPRFTEFDRVDGRTPLLKDEGGMPQPLDPFKFVYTEILAKSGLPIRGGLAKPVAWAWMFKNFTVRDWMAFAEVYGMPLRLGKYGPEASAEEREILLCAVTNIGHDAAAIVSKSMDIDFVDGKQGNSDGALFSGAADWFDRQISKAVLGQTMTTDAGGSGFGGNQANVQDGVREDIETADAKALAASLNRDVVQPMIALNRGQRARRKYPRLMIGRSEAFDAEAMMPVIKAFVDMGGRVGQSVIRDRIGLPDPGKDELLLQPAQKSPEGAVGAPTGTKTPGTPPTDFLELLRGLKSPDRVALASSILAGAAGSDAIERFVAGGLDDWQEQLDPVLAPIETLLASCSTIEEARDRLTEVADTMDGAAMADVLARALFGSRLAGAAGLTIADAVA